jgi:O-antigen/teichoic acid export membrane protein
VWFFLFPFIVNRLGVAAAGVWILVSAITGYFSIIDLGIGPSLIKHVAQYRAEEDLEKLSQAVTTTFVIYLGLGALASAGMFVLGRFFIQFFNIPANLVRDAQLVTYVTALGLLFGFPLGVFGGVLRGLQRYDLSNWAGFIISIPNVVLTLYFLGKGYGVVALTVINVATSGLGWIMNVYYAKEILPSMKIRFSSFRKSIVWDLSGLAVSLFVIQICMLIIYPTDKVIISTFLTIGLVVFYEASFKIYRIVEQFPMQLALAMTPAASELDTLKDYHTLRALFLRGTKYSIALFLAIAIPVLLLSGEILTYWMGPDFAAYSYLVVVFVSYLFLRYNDLFAYFLLVGMDRTRFLVGFYVLSAVTNVCLSLILVQRIGVLGVVLGTAIPYFVFEPFLLRYVLRVFGVPLGSYCRQVLWKTYLPAVICGVLSYLVIRLYVIDSLWDVGFLIGAMGIGYMLLFAWLGMELGERRECLELARSACSSKPFSVKGEPIAY